MIKQIQLIILSISLITITAGAAISPIIGDIAKAFPQYSNTYIKFVITLPAISISIIALCVNKLSHYYSIKKLLVIGFSLFLIGGIGAAFTNNFQVILAYRFILGIGVGIIMPLSNSLVTIYYSGEDKKKMMGYVTACNNMGSAVTMITSGILAIYSWKLSFGVYAIGAIPLFLIIFYLPTNNNVIEKKISLRELLTNRSRTKIKTQISKVEKESNKLSKKVYYSLAQISFYMIMLYYFITNLSILVKTQHIGSSMLSGATLSIFSILAFVAGIALKYIRFDFIKIKVASSLGMALGFVILFYSITPIPILVGASVSGFFFGLLFTILLHEISENSTAKTNVKAMAMATACIYFSQFLSPIIDHQIKELLRIDNIQASFVIGATLLILVGIITLVTNLKISKKTIV